MGSLRIVGNVSLFLILILLFLAIFSRPRFCDSGPSLRTVGSVSLLLVLFLLLLLLLLFLLRVLPRPFLLHAGAAARFVLQRDCFHGASGCMRSCSGVAFVE